jgi:hypothetical protein
MVRTAKSAGGTIRRLAESSFTITVGLTRQQPLGCSLHGHVGAFAGDFGQQPSEWPQQFWDAPPHRSPRQAWEIRGNPTQQHRAGPAAVTKTKYAATSTRIVGILPSYAE